MVPFRYGDVDAEGPQRCCHGGGNMESGCDARLDERGGPRAVVLGLALELTVAERGRKGRSGESAAEDCALLP